MEVLSPYLAAFGTIAGLHKHMCQYTFRTKTALRGGYQRAQTKTCEMARKSPPSALILPAAHPPQM